MAARIRVGECDKLAFMGIASDPALREHPPALNPTGAAVIQRPLSQDLTAGSLALLTGLFWLYVTLSDLIASRGMQITVSQFTDAMIFASWDVRVLQHVLLFPLLLACYSMSLKMGFKGSRALGQGALALAFASAASPVMDLAEMLYHLVLVPQPPGTVWPEQPRAQEAIWVGHFTSFLLTYGFGLALIHGIAFYRRVVRLERQWSAARLSALRMQLSPHTLFNLLHTIRGQIAWDPPAAQETVVQLADVLRRLLSAGQREFCLLAEELQYVGLYLRLQQQRFSDRLSILAPAVEDQPLIWVPSLILQPLVENAVVHGLAGHDGPVEIRVESSLAAEVLTLRVVNTIAAQRPVRPEGIGLSNVRERLLVQFGAQAHLEVGRSGAEWVAQVRLPVLREVKRRQILEPVPAEDTWR
jgi:hypothetical protein